MFANFNYYTSSFKGTKIKTADEYNYLGQQASRYILRYTNEVNADTEDCECALAEYLQSANKSNGISGETIPNAYSVSYAQKDNFTKTNEINSILELYLGDIFSSVGIVKLIG